MNLVFCKCCALAFDPDDIDEDGYCFNCPTELPLDKLPEAPKQYVDFTGDCV